MSEPRFKVGDRVRRINKTSPNGAPVGTKGTVDEDNSDTPLVRWDCGIQDCNEEKNLEPITNDTMSDELKVTKAAVLEAAKCATVGDAIKAMFPEAFNPSDEPFDFGGVAWTTAKAYSEGPLMVANSSVPDNLKNKSLLVCPGWEMRQQEHNGRTILTFHRKP